MIRARRNTVLTHRLERRKSYCSQIPGLIEAQLRVTSKAKGVTQDTVGNTSESSKRVMTDTVEDGLVWQPFSAAQRLRTVTTGPTNCMTFLWA